MLFSNFYESCSKDKTVDYFLQMEIIQGVVGRSLVNSVVSYKDKMVQIVISHISESGLIKM